MNIEYCKNCGKQLTKKWTERMTTKMVCLNCPENISQKVGESFGKHIPKIEEIVNLLAQESIKEKRK